ncbi:AI-2E family transporter [Halorussus gelatinilyticus]|uniref:AI-2E family transporter n=1 Tax=Halorussus gelatinilyticus TaxID=2937524 RepID=A0A8U0IN05_9EURY|nr:AI-2E family transporter [Halorussus gelatinilyticus]UPW01981.1 AI-2E family transporter [Halorussus gelatinilyticus]
MVGLPDERERLAWWGLTLAVAGLFAFVVWSFVGTIVLGVFIYYGARPLYRRLRTEFSSDHAADLTLLIVLVPVLALVGYTVLVGLDQFSQLTGTDFESYAQFVPGSPEQATALVEKVRGVVGPGPAQGQMQEVLSVAVSAFTTLTAGLAHLILSVLLAFTLLREDARIAAWFRGQFGAEGSAAYAYFEAVDEDLHTVFVGNVLTVFAVIVMGLMVYNGLNLLAPASIGVPVPTLLALLTGLATLVPLVVGKIVYVPVGVYLAYQAATGPGPLWFPAAFFGACFVLLDLLPVAVLRPYIAGRNIHGGLMIFAYIGGTMLFGWYGLFLGPLLVVVSVHLARIVLPGLVHGETVTGAVRTAESLGADPKSVVESPVADDAVAAEPTDDADERTTDGGKAPEGEPASEREE